MKICLTYFVMFKIFVLCIFFLIKLVWWNTFTSRAFCTARCIHDELKFAIKDKSPQLYSKIHSSVYLSNKVVNQKPDTYIENNYGYSNVKSTAYDKVNFHHESPEIDINQLDSVQKSSSAAGIVRCQVNTNGFAVSSNLVNDGTYNNSLLEAEKRFFKNASRNFSYTPIRLKIWYDFNYIKFGKSSIEFERLQQGMDRASEKINSLFFVIPIQGNLLLKRVTACGSYWQNSVLTASREKMHRCGRISFNYKGEKCLDGFQIPDIHLAGFSTFDKNGSEPRFTHYEDGVGIPDTDIVIYIRSINTGRCADSSIIGYAAPCQMDQFYRPIAGYANVCPGHLSSKDFDPEKFYLTVLHELFHVLGFSQKMYKYFQSCQVQSTSTLLGKEMQNTIEDNTSFSCEKQYGVVDFIDGWHRILSFSVVKEAAQHFNCSNMGGPLESVSNKFMESSHWESRIFQSSLMTGSIGMPHLTFIDRITLALFNDTGWYKVNMNEASDLIWGKNAGCEFGDLKYCHNTNNTLFCDIPSTMGCHFLHLDKGVCKTNELLDSCFVYKAVKGGECWNPAYNGNKHLYRGETYNANSRCFVSNIFPLNEKENFNRSKRGIFDGEGRCYEMRCNDTKTLEIRVKGAVWVLCKRNERVQIPGYIGFVICPPSTIMCNKNISWRSTTLLGSAICVHITLIFPGLHEYAIAHSKSKETDEMWLIKFVGILSTIIDQLIKENNASIVNSPQVSRNSVNFSLKSLLSNSHSCPQAVRSVKYAVESNILEVEVDGKQFAAMQILTTYTFQPCSSPFHSNNSDLLEMNDLTKTKKPFSTQSNSPGIVAAAIVGAVCVFVFATVWAILYVKSVIPNAVGPTAGLEGPEVSYHPNSQVSPSSVSESGSVGQIQFVS